MRSRRAPRVLARAFVVTEIDQDLVLPDGVDELVCDQAIVGVGRAAVSAVVVGNRMLILPVPQQLLGDQTVRLEPHQTVWDALSRRGCSVAVEPSEGLVDLPAVISNSGTDLESRDGSDSGVGRNSPSLNEQAMPVARSIRSEQTSSPYAIEAVSVRHRPNTGGAAPSGRGVLQVDVQIRTGQLVVVCNAQSGEARTAVNVLAGLELPDSGTVLHRGIPCNSADPQHQRFMTVQPGIYSGRIAHANEVSGLEYVAYPSLFYGTDAAVARADAAVTLARLLGSSAEGQPIATMTTQERQVAMLARALAGEWELVVLFDPMRSLAEDVQVVVRSFVAERVAAGATVVVLTDDEPLLALADRRMAVVDGVLRDAHPNGDPSGARTVEKRVRHRYDKVRGRVRP